MRTRQRIAGRLGHLHNEAAAQILARIDTSRLVHIIAAHLSQENNTPVLARAALSAALCCAPEWIGIADQALGFDWRDTVAIVLLTMALVRGGGELTTGWGSLACFPVLAVADVGIAVAIAARARAARAIAVEPARS